MKKSIFSHGFYDDYIREINIKRASILVLQRVIIRAKPINKTFDILSSGVGSCRLVPRDDSGISTGLCLCAKSTDIVTTVSGIKELACLYQQLPLILRSIHRLLKHCLVLCVCMVSLKDKAPAKFLNLSMVQKHRNLD